MTEVRGADAAPTGRSAGGGSTGPRGAEQDDPPTTVLPSGAGRAPAPSAGAATGAATGGTPVPGPVQGSAAGPPGPGTPGGGTPRPAPVRTVPPRPVGRSDLRPPSGRTPLTAGRSRRARLSLRRIDPWSVFVFTLVASIFVGVALVVAVAALFSVLGSLGVTGSVNELFSEVTGGLADNGPLLTFGRVVGGAAVLAAVNIVFLTLLATLSALLYNLCASFTGGIELTLGDDD